MFFNKEQPTPDMLTQKQQKLDTYSLQRNNAIGMIVSTIEELDSANTEIATTIAEIEDYQAKLKGVVDELAETRLRNENIISNFKALVCLN